MMKVEMNRNFKFWRFIHKWSGRIIVIFFLMWFVSGLILIYHPYPKLTENEIYKRLPLFSVQDTAEAQNQLSPSEIAKKWLPYDVVKVDTLRDLGVWVIQPKYEKDLPIYRFYYDDPDKTELFISGTSLNPIQQTNFKQRLWSYFGAIPHKFYIPSLRKNTETWKKIVTVGGVFCFIAALSGLIEGIIILRRRFKKTGKIGNPYKKWPMRLHFGFGICVGLFLITWGISGIFAMNKVPEWLSPTKDELSITQNTLWGKKELPDSCYLLTPATLLKEYPELKTFEKQHFGSFPAIKAVIGDSAYYFDATSETPLRMHIPDSAVRKQISKITGDSLYFTIRKLNNFTEYYMPRLRGQANLPVYEVKIEDNVGSTVYIDPSDGYMRYITNHKRIRKWLFEGFHYWNINGFYTVKPVWTIAIWAACISCIIVCLTGIIITFNKIFRQ